LFEHKIDVGGILKKRNMLAEYHGHGGFHGNICGANKADWWLSAPRINIDIDEYNIRKEMGINPCLSYRIP